MPTGRTRQEDGLLRVGLFGAQLLHISPQRELMNTREPEHIVQLCAVRLTLHTDRCGGPSVGGSPFALSGIDRLMQGERYLHMSRDRCHFN